jgi:UDP-glucose:glycoprotein glucosyltransferase
MMLTVRRTTQQPVKFWILGNWLSPQFKEYVPEMSKRYNFSVEFVTYKWPSWLQQQTEKQRIIWG